MAKPLRPGQLNPLNFSLKTPIATPDKIIDNPMSIYGQSISNLMNPNLFEGVMQFKAQVLLSVDAEEESGTLWQILRSTLPESVAGHIAPQNKFCICRIPEIHQAFADPNIYEDGDPRKAKAILKHPVFEVNISKLEKEGSQKLTIGPGSIVNVTFFDALKRTGEVTSIILDSSDPNPLEGTGGARAAHASGQQISGPLGGNQAIWFTPTNGREIKQIVLHITAGRAGPGRAQATIDYFAGKRGTEILNGKRTVSIHYAIDQGGTIVQGVEEKDIAYHAGNANANTIGIEMTGNPGIDDGSEYTKNIGGRAGNWPPAGTRRTYEALGPAMSSFESSEPQGTNGVLLDGPSKPSFTGPYSPEWEAISAGKGYLGKYAGMYTEELIEGVAKLCAEICDRYNLPVSRKTIIGHEDLKPGSKWGPGDSLNKRYPDGGGAYWNWDDFLSRVKGYSAQVSPELVEELYGL